MILGLGRRTSCDEVVGSPGSYPECNSIRRGLSRGNDRPWEYVRQVVWRRSSCRMCSFRTVQRGGELEEVTTGLRWNWETSISWSRLFVTSVQEIPLYCVRESDWETLDQFFTVWSSSVLSNHQFSYLRPYLDGPNFRQMSDYWNWGTRVKK